MARTEGVSPDARLGGKYGAWSMRWRNEGERVWRFELEIRSTYESQNFGALLADKLLHFLPQPLASPLHSSRNKLLFDSLLDHSLTLFVPSPRRVTEAVRCKCLIEPTLEFSSHLWRESDGHGDEVIRLRCENMEELGRVKHLNDALLVEIFEVLCILAQHWEYA